MKIPKSSSGLSQLSNHVSCGCYADPTLNLDLLTIFSSHQKRYDWNAILVYIIRSPAERSLKAAQSSSVQTFFSHTCLSCLSSIPPASGAPFSPAGLPPPSLAGALSGRKMGRIKELLNTSLSPLMSGSSVIKEYKVLLFLEP